MKNPKLFTPQDLISYKQILFETPIQLTADGSRIRKDRIKNETIIKKLFFFGEGMKYDGFKLQKHI